MLRTCLILTTITAFVAMGCTTTTPSSRPLETAASGSDGLSDADLLRLEDRREFDGAILMAWASDPRPERRRRAAIALARIGTATFEDRNGDGWQDTNEPMAGSPMLLTLTADPDPSVRAAAAFAFGESGDLRGFESLFALARDDDPAVSSRAAEALSKLAPQIPFERYEELLAPDVPVAARRTATRYLFRFATDRASGNAALLLNSQDADLRREAAYSLSRHAIPQARRRIEALLAEPDVLTRSYAARALGRIASPSSVDPLLDVATEPHAWVRTNALRALGEILDRAAVDVSVEQLARIADTALALISDPDTGTAASAIELAGRIGPKSPAIRERLQGVATSASPWHRELAVHWLVRAFGIESVGAIGRLDDPWMKVRIVEGASAGKDGVEVRRRFSADPAPSVRAAVISNLPRPVPADELPALRAAIDDADPVVRGAALAYVAEAFPNEASTILREAEIRARADTMDDARLAAIEARAKLGADDLRDWLESLLGDRDPVVRRVAADRLAETEGKRPQYTPLPVLRDRSEYERIARWAAGRHIASIEMPRGEIRIALRSDEAPMTAWNFARLASEGYFAGTTFMRVVPNFVIQGGDPRNDMSGGPGYAIRDEINMIEYARGTVGMALSGPDTGGSQFFATHSPQPHLDGGYTVFGHVISGRGTILEQVERGDRVTRVIVREGDWTQLEIDKVAGVPLPTVIGEMTVEDLMRIVPEYPERRASYTPDPDVVSYMASLVQPGDRLTVVLGTWCHDSQREVPRLVRILDDLRALGVDIPVRFIAVNREKNEPSDLIDGMGIEMVSTIAYTREGAELGRIVETPEGLLEDHLLRLVMAQ
jgi:cyclophilin family peptidyl-prolyl cis-trans isomerase/HEAT repeat protein